MHTCFETRKRRSRREFLVATVSPAVGAASARAGTPRTGREAPKSSLLDPDGFRHYVEAFNRTFEEGVANAIPDAKAWSWMVDNVPFFSCPDKEFEEVYYYRWWTFRKHIKSTAAGFIVTEFLRPVRHATDINAISCALGHHLREGRWLHDAWYLDDYLRFWLTSGPSGGLQSHLHQYSGWAADGAYNRWLVNRDTAFLVSLLDALLLDFETWRRERGLPDGLFWQHDVADGMEESDSGSRQAQNARPTINSYMYGNARALARIATLAGRADLAGHFEDASYAQKERVQKRLWDSTAHFFKSRLENGVLADVREAVGFTPWYFELPDARQGYEEAWRQLTDRRGFLAPFGPRTAEQRHPRFRIAYEGDDCQWNGPSWPFATSVTLTALANLLHNDSQSVLSRRDYFEVLRIYVSSQHRRLPDGRLVPWIDENLNPFTGEWLARERKIRKGRFDGRGDHYNHSTFCDLVISGLVGLRPRSDDIVEVHPLLPDTVWDWFCLDRVRYHDRRLAIVWDRTGAVYGCGRGLRVFADGREIAHSPSLAAMRGRWSNEGS